MLIYLAHPIDQDLRSVASRTADDIHQTLTRIGLAIYRPATAFTSGALAADAINHVNGTALSRANAVVAWLPRGVPTFGTPAEIESALRQNKPTLIFTDEILATTSVQVADWRNRGAGVFVWSERAARVFENKPEILLEALASGRGSADLQVQVHGSQAKTPSRAHPTDAGFDLAISVETKLAPGEYKLVPTGVRTALPEGYWGLIIGRSSSWAKLRLDIKLGVIDHDYRGELMVGVQNMQASSIVLEAGMRLAQYVLLPAYMGGLVQVDELPEAISRGEAGFGSSGA